MNETFYHHFALILGVYIAKLLCRLSMSCLLIISGDITVTVYPKKYAHGFVVLCFVVVMQSFIMNSHEVFIHIHQGCFAGTGAIVRLPQCQWSKPDVYGKISQCITTTKHSKAKTVCIFLGIYCMLHERHVFSDHWPLECLLNSLFKSPHYWPFVKGQCLMDSPHKGPIMQKAVPVHDVIMDLLWHHMVISPFCDTS